MKNSLVLCGIYLKHLLRAKRILHTIQIITGKNIIKKSLMPFLLDAGFFTAKVSEVEDTCPANNTHFIHHNLLNER